MWYKDTPSDQSGMALDTIAILKIGMLVTNVEEWMYTGDRKKSRKFVVTGEGGRTFFIEVKLHFYSSEGFIILWHIAQIQVNLN